MLTSTHPFLRHCGLYGYSSSWLLAPGHIGRLTHGWLQTGWVWICQMGNFSVCLKFIIVGYTTYCTDTNVYICFNQWRSRASIVFSSLGVHMSSLITCLFNNCQTLIWNERIHFLSSLFTVKWISSAGYWWLWILLKLSTWPIGSNGAWTSNIQITRHRETKLSSLNLGIVSSWLGAS